MDKKACNHDKGAFREYGKVNFRKGSMRIQKVAYSRASVAIEAKAWRTGFSKHEMLVHCWKNFASFPRSLAVRLAAQVRA